MRKLVILLTLTLGLALACPAVGLAGGEMDTQSILSEIQTLKAKLAEMDDLKKRVQELEGQLDAAKTKASEASLAAGAASKKADGVLVQLQEATRFRVHGAVDMNYSVGDFNEAGKAKGGDAGFNFFRVDFSGKHNNLELSAQYRWYSYMDVIHHAWIGYNFSDTNQLQVGVTQVPFGLLPYASHNWWFGITYYVGLEDDYDMGIKWVYKPGPLDIQLAFFKNAEWASPGKLERYSYDVVTTDDAFNEETNQVNARVAYTIALSDATKFVLGASGQIGQLYNSATDDFGWHWAGALHANATLGQFGFQLQAARYQYNQDVDPGSDMAVIKFGAFADAFDIAASANLYTANVSYDLPVTLGPISNLTFYNDFTWLQKDDESFEDSYINTLGFLISADPVYAYVDFIFGKNALYLGGPRDSFAAGDPDADWHMLFNFNVGYYF